MVCKYVDIYHKVFEHQVKIGVSHISPQSVECFFFVSLLFYVRAGCFLFSCKIYNNLFFIDFYVDLLLKSFCMPLQSSAVQRFIEKKSIKEKIA